MRKLKHRLDKDPNEVTNYSEKDLISYIAKEYFFYGDEYHDVQLKHLGGGTKGNAYEVKGEGKVIKLTNDRDEALRAYRLRGKSERNLIGYYDVRKVRNLKKHFGGDFFRTEGLQDDFYILLMDKLPYNLVTYKNGLGSDVYDAFQDILSEVNDFDVNLAVDPDQEDYEYEIPGYDIKYKKKLKDFISDTVEQLPDSFYKSRLIKGKGNSIKDFRELLKSMWYDIIQIRRQLKKYNILTNDMTGGNLGFKKDGTLVFYDLGYPGEGEKELPKSKHIEAPQTLESNIILEFAQFKKIYLK